MRVTSRCMHKGFWGRSADELKRLSSIAWNLEGIKGPSGPKPLFDFHRPEAIKDCKLMCDVDIGGFSKAAFDHIPASSIGDDQIPAHARFYGSISTALPKTRPDVQRSGFAAWRTKDMPPTIFGRTVWDVDMYRYIALRVKSDGRSYYVNLQTESVVPEDLHQHRLFAKRPGEWETIIIKWIDFVRTNHGFVIEPQTEIMKQKVKSVGIGLTDRVPGPFDLSIERIWATNDASEVGGDHAVVSLSPEEALSTAAAPDADPGPNISGQLRNKQGRSIKWSD